MGTADPKKERLSAGLLMFRTKDRVLELLLAHPGGPYFSKKDEGHWSIPKGEPDEGEELFDAAVREFKEETGITPGGSFIPIGSVVQKGGKIVHAWAFEGSSGPDPQHISNTFELEWPPRSGRIMSFPEIDRVEFFASEVAKVKIKQAQVPFIERLMQNLGKS